MSVLDKLLPEFFIKVDRELCIKCGQCVKNCGFSALMQDKDKNVKPIHEKCVACQRCMYVCPTKAIQVINFPGTQKNNEYWKPEYIKNIKKQANSGGILLTAAGNDKPYPVIFDRLLLDACQVTNPSIDPLREPMEIISYLGEKPIDISIEFRDNKYVLKDKLKPNIKLNSPIIFAAMSYGAISLNAHKALAKAARECGILMNTGEGGLHRDLYEYSDNIIVQVASGRFGVSPEYLKRSAAIEIKVGQGAKPGIGGHLPGYKVDDEVSSTRMIPKGTDALSPAPHHDIYSIEDLAQLIASLKEATDYSKPVGVKIAAVHNIAAIASGVARADADYIVIDGFRGGTGAAPTMIRDHIGIPIELAIAAVDDRLRKEKIRNKVSIVAAGGIRHAADMAKALALGADFVTIGTVALIAMGCTLCQKCYTGNCSWGIATQRPDLVERLNPDEASKKLVNLIRGWSLELKEIMGALGINAIESLVGNRERLRALELSRETLDVLGVKPAGR
ncbi:Glutamate synthase (NADPH) [Thermodesulfobium narugense DSM 14796]|uniref:glutamate synthase (NADPH) n=1 Tax=Thermodesulfobium narugense DSM 14796 TaxID=747365 RepID=M1E7L8_9BACT|nr:glutamate synthase-related protein [Thermodesulfobium narugense]AEE14530.1 Glutamate synthase (NADPH) [Thermodesulfobium narugense DSM 14796]